MVMIIPLNPKQPPTAVSLKFGQRTKIYGNQIATKPTTSTT